MADKTSATYLSPDLQRSNLLIIKLFYLKVCRVADISQKTIIIGEVIIHE